MYYLAQQEYITQLLHNCHIFANAKPFENKDRCSPGIRTHVGPSNYRKPPQTTTNHRKPPIKPPQTTFNIIVLNALNVMGIC